MFIDSKGKLFGKISIIDILIILVVLAGTAGLAYKVNNSKTITPFTKTDDIQVVFSADEIPEFVAKVMKVGDIVKDPIKGTVFGKVKDIKKGTSISRVETADGRIVVAERPGYVSLKVTIEGKGIYTNSGITFDNADYYIGKSLEIRVGNTAIYTRIYDLKKVKG